MSFVREEKRGQAFSLDLAIPCVCLLNPQPNPCILDTPSFTSKLSEMYAGDKFGSLETLSQADDQQLLE